MVLFSQALDPGFNSRPWSGTWFSTWPCPKESQVLVNIYPSGCICLRPPQETPQTQVPSPAPLLQHMRSQTLCLFAWNSLPHPGTTCTPSLGPPFPEWEVGNIKSHILSMLSSERLSNVKWRESTGPHRLICNSEIQKAQKSKRCFIIHLLANSDMI